MLKYLSSCEYPVNVEAVWIVGRWWSWNWPCHGHCEFKQASSPAMAQFPHLNSVLLPPEAHPGSDLFVLGMVTELRSQQRE